LSHLITWQCFWGRFGGSIFSHSFVHRRCLSCCFFGCGSFGYLVVLVLGWAFFNLRLFSGFLSGRLLQRRFFLCGSVCNVIRCCIIGSYRFCRSVVLRRFS
jgi:hypothetical protein